MAPTGRETMSLLIILLLAQVFSVITQYTLLNRQFGLECRKDVEIQRLVTMMENMRSDMTKMETNLNTAKSAYKRSEKKIFELGDTITQLSDKNEILQTKFVELESTLTNQDKVFRHHSKTINSLQAKVSLLESESQTSSVAESSTTHAMESSTPNVKNSMTQNVVDSTTQNVVDSTSEDCEDLRALGNQTSGVYSVHGGNGQIKQIYCDMSPDGMVWMRILHIQDNIVDFTWKKWADYEAGFGEILGSHWMGLIQMQTLTTAPDYKMRVDLVDWAGNTAHAEYSTFREGPGSDKYRLTIWGYSGTAGDSMGSGCHNNMLFTTIDSDNDLYLYNCADGTGWWTGGWRYNKCFCALLTGPYLEGGVTIAHGIQWTGWRGDSYPYKVATMKIQCL